MLLLKKIVPALLLLPVMSCAVETAPPVVSEPVSLFTSPPPVIAMAGPEEGFKLAMEAYAIGDMSTAVIIARQVVERFQGNPWQKRALFLKGRASIALGMSGEAEDSLLRVPAEYPVLADYSLYYLSEFYFSRKRYAEAAALCQRLLDQYPKSFWVIRASFRKAQALFESGAYAGAAGAFEKFLNDYPRSEFSPDAGLELGRARAAEGKTEEAVRAYQDVYIKYPGGPDADVEKALADLKKSGIAVPDLTATELYERGRNLFKANQYEKAAAVFPRVLELDSAFSSAADVLVRSGISLYCLGKRVDAAVVLEQVVKDYPNDERCAEALHWLARCYDRLGRREDAVKAYLRIITSFAGSEWADDALYIIGSIYRDSGDHAKAVDFYSRLAAKYPDSKFADSAFWWKAWAYYGAGEYQKTEQTLQELISRYPKSFLVNQARYWQGRAAEKAGDIAKAGRYYGIVLKRAPYAYYGYRAAERLSSIKISPAAAATEAAVEGNKITENSSTEGQPEQDDLDGPPVWTSEAVKILSADPSFAKSLELLYHNMKKEAAAELWTIQDRVPKKRGTLIGLSKTFFELGDYYRALILVLRNYERYLDGEFRETPEDFWLLAYPQGYWDSIVSYARKYGQDPHFVAAIIHQESQFNAEALSPAGARGVMQVMPSTGEWAAQTIGMRGFDSGKLFDADTAINIGTWYISHLMKRFKGDALFAAASYNAGPDAVASWLERTGRNNDRDEFVESIPFFETRRYVKKVLRNYAEYKRVYGRVQGIPRFPAEQGGAAGSLMTKHEEKTP